MKTRHSLNLLLILLLPSFVAAFETDQFSNRQEIIADAGSAMNRQVNLAIANSIIGWQGKRNEMKVVNNVYHKIGGQYWVDKLEQWAMDSGEIERLSTPAHESIYQGLPVWATRVASVYGIGATININGTLVGTDKFGHFQSQGRKFYKRWLKSHDESKAAEQSAYTERAIFGQMTTGSYSNADLVANYEGYLFYRSLFEDNIIAGKPAILKWEQGHWIMQRPFVWADDINDYWDEALNINQYDALLYPYMEAHFRTLCDYYWSDPGLFEVHDEEALKQRYHNIQLRETSELRLSNLCVTESPAEFETMGGKQ